MINIKFNINKYDWEVNLYLNVDKFDIEYILRKLHELNCEYHKAIQAYKIISNDYINKGFTYTNYNSKSSLIIICKTDSKSQTINTIIHELNHLKSHIANAYDLDEKGEEVSYLIGNVAEIIYNKINEN